MKRLRQMMAWTEVSFLGSLLVAAATRSSNEEHMGHRLLAGGTSSSVAGTCIGTVEDAQLYLVTHMVSQGILRNVRVQNHVSPDE
jgi:hypothetical protein